jgi:hypothetical protein
MQYTFGKEAPDWDQSLMGDSKRTDCERTDDCDGVHTTTPGERAWVEANDKKFPTNNVRSLSLSLAQLSAHRGERTFCPRST